MYSNSQNSNRDQEGQKRHSSTFVPYQARRCYRCGCYGHMMKSCSSQPTPRSMESLPAQHVSAVTKRSQLDPDAIRSPMLQPSRDANVAKQHDKNAVPTCDIEEDLQALDFPEFFCPHEAYIVPIRPLPEPLPASMGLADLQASLNDKGQHITNRIAVSTYLQDLDDNGYLTNITQKTASSSIFLDPAFTKIDLTSRVVSFEEMQANVIIFAENEDYDDPEVSAKFDVGYLHMVPEFVHHHDSDILSPEQEARLAGLGVTKAEDAYDSPADASGILNVSTMRTSAEQPSIHLQKESTPSERSCPSPTSHPTQMQAPYATSPSLSGKYELVLSAFTEHSCNVSHSGLPPCRSSKTSQSKTHALPPWRRNQNSQYSKYFPSHTQAMPCRNQSTTAEVSPLVKLATGSESAKDNPRKRKRKPFNSTSLYPLFSEDNSDDAYELTKSQDSAHAKNEPRRNCTSNHVRKHVKTKESTSIEADGNGHVDCGSGYYY